MTIDLSWKPSYIRYKKWPKNHDFKKTVIDHLKT